MGGMGGMGGMPGMGGYGGGMRNFNMSNAVDVRTCSTVTTEDNSPQTSPFSRVDDNKEHITDSLTSKTSDEQIASPSDVAEKPYDQQISSGTYDTRVCTRHLRTASVHTSHHLAVKFCTKKGSHSYSNANLLKDLTVKLLVEANLSSISDRACPIESQM